MGTYLSQPNTAKDSFDGEGNCVKYGASSMQGWRGSMEDDHIVDAGFNNSDDTSLFAVFDGHGGSEVAKFCSKVKDFFPNPPALRTRASEEPEFPPRELRARPPRDIPLHGRAPIFPRRSTRAPGFPGRGRNARIKRRVHCERSLNPQEKYLLCKFWRFKNHPFQKKDFFCLGQIRLSRIWLLDPAVD
jgi:hypothetical protein